MPGSRPQCSRANVDRLILIGDEMRPARRGARRPRCGRPRRQCRGSDRRAASHCSARAMRCWSRRAIRSGLRSSSRAWQRSRMLYLIAEQLGFPGVLNLIRYISFRAGAASATALLIGLLLGPRFISWLRAKQGKGQPIRSRRPAKPPRQARHADHGRPADPDLGVDLRPAVDGPPQPLCLGMPAGHRRVRTDRLARRLRQGARRRTMPAFRARRGSRWNS